MLAGGQHFRPTCVKGIVEPINAIAAVASGERLCRSLMSREEGSEDGRAIALAQRSPRLEDSAKLWAMKPRPIIPGYQMIAIAVVILAGIVVTMLQEGTWLRRLIDGTCDRAHDCPPPVEGLGRVGIRP